MDMDTCSVCYSPVFTVGALYCSDSCRRSDAACSSSSSAARPCARTPSPQQSTRRPQLQLTISMPVSFAHPASPSNLQLQSRSAISPRPSASIALPTPQQLASRTRRYTAPSSSRAHAMPSPASSSLFPSKRLVPSSYRPAAYASPEELARDMARLPESPVAAFPSASSSSSLRQQQRGFDLWEEESASATPSVPSSQTIASPPMPDPHQPRYTGKDNHGLLAWVAQVKAHAPAPAPVPTLRIPSPTSSSRRTPLASSASASPRPFLPLSKPLPAPPIITAPSVSSSPFTTSKKLVVSAEECEADESATLVTPPSSSALDTLSLSLSAASFHFDVDEERTSAPSSVLSFGCERRSPSPRSLSQSSAEKTLSPPPTTPAVQRKKGTFTLTPRRASGSDSESDSESESESGSECSFDDDEGALSRSSSFGCISASATTPSFHTQQSSSRQQVKGRQHKVYSLEDVLLPSTSTSVSCSVSPAPASHFSDSEEEEEESDVDEEEEGEGERDEDLWQVRGRAPRTVLVC